MASAWRGQHLGQRLACFQLFLEEKVVPEHFPCVCREEDAIRVLSVPRRPWEEGRLCPGGGVNLESGSLGGTGLHAWEVSMGKGFSTCSSFGWELSVVGGSPAYRGRLITSGRFIPEPCNPLHTCLLPREAIKLPSTETVLSASGLHQKCLLSPPPPTRGFCLPGMREAAGKGSPSPCGTDGLAD